MLEKNLSMIVSKNLHVINALDRNINHLLIGNESNFPIK